MRVLIQCPSTPPPTSDASAINISSSSSLSITLAFSNAPIIQHKPVVLPNGIISTSPPYHSGASQPTFVPYRPTFEPPSITQALRSGSKDRQRHAALIEHSSAELRENRGRWGDVARECRKGRGGYNAPRRVWRQSRGSWDVRVSEGAAGGRSHCTDVVLDVITVVSVAWIPSV
jgi:hypothetical protein